MFTALYIVILILVLVLVLGASKSSKTDNDLVISFVGQTKLIDATKDRYINDNNLYTLKGQTEFQTKLNTQTNLSKV